MVGLDIFRLNRMHGQLVVFLAAALLCSSANARVFVWVDIPHDESSTRDSVRESPEIAESSLLLFLVQSLSLADRRVKRDDVSEFPFCYANLSKADLEKRVGRSLEWKQWKRFEDVRSDYVRPCAGDQIISLIHVRHRDLNQLGARARFYELSDIGGMLVFYSAANVAISPGIVYLRTDDGFVPLRPGADPLQRLKWESERLRKLKKWLRIREDVVKDANGEFFVKRE